MKNNCISFANTILASNPIKIVTVHNMFPKRDECSDFEYSFFFENLVSKNCITTRTPKTNGTLYHTCSIAMSDKYPKYVASTITAATTSDTTSEK